MKFQKFINHQHEMHIAPLILGAAIAGGTSLLGGILGNEANRRNTAASNAQAAKNTAAANATNLQIARENTQFQERMSNSAYQRAMADMGKAGLNPMLAYQQGGAGTPTGSTATMQAAPVQTPNYQDPLAPAVSSAMNTYQTTNTVKIAAQQLGINQANSSADIALKAAQAQATANSAKKTLTEIDILNARAKKEKLEGKFYDSEHGKNFYYLQKLNEAVGGSLDSLNGAKKLLNPFDLFPKRPQRIQEKLNRETGEIELWRR